MRILVTSDIAHGGAATACRRLVRELKILEGHDVTWLVAKGEDDSDVTGVHLREGPLVWLVSRYFGRWSTRKRLSEKLLRHRYARKWAAEIARRKPSIVNLHNIHHAADFNLMRHLPGEIPLVWTLHDMWALTGGCGYAYECLKYLDGCKGECAGIGPLGTAMEGASDTWRKRELWMRANANRLQLVAPSRWLAEVVKKRFQGEVPVSHIPYGVPLDVFRPVNDRSGARRSLDLPDKGKVVLFVTARLDDSRKGFDLFKEASVRLRQKFGGDVCFVAVGDGTVGMVPEGDFICRGSIRDEDTLNLYYNAADVFVHPARQDNLPNTLLEALAAGTPSVTFDIGGCGDIVRNAETGRLVESVSAEGLSAGIVDLLEMSPAQMSNMRSKCRAVAEREFNMELQAKRYMKLFTSISAQHED